MRFLKIMGIFTSILSLLSCGHGNKRVTQNDGINSNIPVAARITIDKLPDVLRNVQAGNTDYDFIGICSNGVDCIYFVLENGKFYIDFEAMGKEQLPYIDTLKQFAKEHNTDIEQKPYYPYSTPNSVFHKLPTMVYQNGKSSFWQCQG